MISGTQADVDLPWPVKYRLHGWSFTFGKKGGVDYWDSFKKMKTIALFSDILKLPVKQYDVVITDFEPISAWAAKLKGVPCISIGHQASFLSPKTPRPAKKNWFVEQIFKYYSPAKQAIGFHFESYDSFIRTPVIRSEIRALKPSNQGHVTVYLPAHDDKLLLSYFSKVKEVNWEVFSKHSKNIYEQEHVKVFPINNERYNKSLETCMGLITAGGFEAPTEAIFLGKKVMVIPMIGQYEQHCNAIGAKKAGCTVVPEINENFIAHIKSWIEFAKPVHINYPDETDQILSEILEPYKK